MFVQLCVAFFICVYGHVSLFSPLPLCSCQDACLVRGGSETKTVDNKHKPSVRVRKVGWAGLEEEGRKKVAYSGDQCLFQSRRLHGGVCVCLRGLHVCESRGGDGRGPSLDRQESDGYPAKCWWDIINAAG